MKKTTKITSVLLIAISLVAASFVTPKTHAVGPTTLGIWSDTYKSNVVGDTTLIAATSFTVKVNVTNAGTINGFDVTVVYDATVLTASAATNIFASVPCVPGCLFVLKNDVSTAGVVRVAAVLLGATVDGTNLSLFSIPFSVKAVGTTSLHIDTTVSTITNPGPVPYTPIDGTFSNVAVTGSITVAPSLIFVGNQVTFSATVANTLGPTTLRWDVLCDGIIDGTGSSLAFTFGGRGGVSVCLIVNDQHSKPSTILQSFTVWAPVKFAAFKWDDGTKAFFVKYKVLASFSPPLTTDISVHIDIFRASDGTTAGSLDATYLAQPQRTGIIKEVPWTACSPTVTTNCFMPGVAYNATGHITFTTLDATNQSDGTRTTSFVPS